jgi:hypothetical protein
LLQVKNVNAVTLAENKRLHAGIPAACVVTEVNTCFKKLAHSKARKGHDSLLFSG